MLQLGLRLEISLEDLLKLGVLCDKEAVNKSLNGQGSISCPCVEVCTETLVRRESQC